MLNSQYCKPLYVFGPVFGLAMVILCFASGAFAYKVNVHANLTTRAFAQADRAQETLGQWGVSPNDNYPYKVSLVGPLFRSRGEGTPSAILAEGAVFEDKALFARAVWHFFDPRSLQGLRFGSGPGNGNAPYANSPEHIMLGHALEESRYQYALEQAHLALTDPDQEEREEATGNLFLSLGQVVHHIQDMAQPQHVRDDAHLPRFVLGEGAAYEEYTGDVRRIIPPLTPTGQYGPFQDFDLARVETGLDFWTDSYLQVSSQDDENYGVGMAQFSQANWVSEETNFRHRFDSPQQSFERLAHPHFPFPDPNLHQPIAVTAFELGIGSFPPFEEAFLQPTNQYDALTDMTTVKERTSTISMFFDPEIFGQDSYGIEFVQFPANWDHAFEELAPRAVHYSKGMLDFFFRGRFEFVELTGDMGLPVLRFKNVSLGGFDLVDGSFELFFDQPTVEDPDLMERIPIETLTEGVLDEPVFNGEEFDIVISDPSGNDILRSDPHLTLVFRGRIGRSDSPDLDQHEGLKSIDAVAALGFDFTNSPGFVFDSSNWPPNGPPQPPFILEMENGRWTLQPETGTALGGGVDWFGFYESGRPTMQLSWGPDINRYGIEFRGSRHGAGHHNVIYQNGGFLTNAPPGCDLLGAALRREPILWPEYEEWIVIICEASLGGMEAAYRRPALLDVGGQVYEWIGMGQASQPDGVIDNPHRAPWLFNGDGTQATSIRQVEGPPVSTGGQQSGIFLIHVMATLNDGTFVIADMGEEHVSQTNSDSVEITCNDDLRTYEATVTNTYSGATVVATDFRDQELLVARVHETTVSEVTTEKRANGVGQNLKGSIKTSASGGRYLIVNGETVLPVEIRQADSTANYDSDAIAVVAAETNLKNDLFDLDLRHGVFLYYAAGGERYGTSDALSNVHYVGESRSGVNLQEGGALRELQLDVESIEETRTPENLGGANFCGDPTGNSSSTDPVEVVIPYAGGYNGGFAVDGLGNVFVSINGQTRLNYLSNGDLTEAIGVSADTVFYDINTR